MSNSFCLTVDIESTHIGTGLSYKVEFQLPTQGLFPAQIAEFPQWAEEVRDAVLSAGDLPFSPDSYTRKLAIAELMHALDDINNRYDIQIGQEKDIPAVQIQSGNPHSRKIDINFSGNDGLFHVTETCLAEKDRAPAREHGKTGIIDNGNARMPFKPPHKPQAFRPRF